MLRSSEYLCFKNLSGLTKRYKNKYLQGFENLAGTQTSFLPQIMKKQK